MSGFQEASSILREIIIQHRIRYQFPLACNPIMCYIVIKGKATEAATLYSVKLMFYALAVNYSE